jgi:hypothetical protein
MQKLVPIFAGVLFALTGTLSGVAQAANDAGQVTHLSGTLVAKRADGTTKLLSVKSEIREGDTLSTAKDTYARMKFTDGGEIVLRPGSQLKVDAYSFNQAKPESDNIFMSMLKGGMRVVTGLVGKRNRNAVTFGTVTATIGIRGTHFGALLCQAEAGGGNDCADVATVSGKPPEDGLHVDVADGAIVLKNKGGELLIASGQFGFVQNPLLAPIIVPPTQGIQVTMPTSISQNSAAGRGVGKGGSSECAVQ